MKSRLDVALRPVSESDATEFCRVLRRNLDFLKPWEPYRAPAWFTLDGQLDRLRSDVAAMAAGTAWVFAILDSSNGTIIGQIALRNVVRGIWQNATLGYWVDAEHNGRGAATGAVTRCIDAAFGEHRLHRVQAAVMPRNLASARVLQKAGFRYEGHSPRYLKINNVWEDHDVYAITAEEWPR